MPPNHSSVWLLRRGLQEIPANSWTERVVSVPGGVRRSAAGRDGRQRDSVHARRIVADAQFAGRTSRHWSCSRDTARDVLSYSPSTSCSFHFSIPSTHASKEARAFIYRQLLLIFSIICSSIIINSYTSTSCYHARASCATCSGRTLKRVPGGPETRRAAPGGRGAPTWPTSFCKRTASRSSHAHTSSSWTCALCPVSLPLPALASFSVWFSFCSLEAMSSLFVRTTRTLQTCAAGSVCRGCASHLL